MNDPEKGYRGPKKEGLDFFVEHVVWKQLPKELFEKFGGREEAKLKRQAILISQGKGKIPASAVKESATNAKEAIHEIPTDSNSESALAAKIELPESSLQTDVATAAALVECDSMVKQENTVDLKRKRSLSDTDGSQLEGDHVLTAQSQADLEAALEEAEFQSLLLAQNSEGSFQSEHVSPASKIPLPSLLPHLTPVWEAKRTRAPYRVPVVTWTILDI